MQQYLDLLGHKARDKVTGFEGVATSVAFDLFGCVQVAIQPQMDEKTSDKATGHWFDHKRLAILPGDPVMRRPTFDTPGKEPGPAEKPAF